MKKKNTRQKLTEGMSDIQRMFANAIDYDALDRALEDPKVIEILNKIKL